MLKRMFALRSIALAVACFLALAVSGYSETEQVLYSFTGGNDGGEPFGGLVLDSKGNLYGTTYQFGAGSGGTVFELTPNSNGTWSEQTVYTFMPFSGNGDAGDPTGSLIFDSMGNLYGTSSLGGTFEGGTVYELVQGAGGTWTDKVLYSFTGGTDGYFPYGNGVVFDSVGNLYGTTAYGGAYGFGVAFELTPTSGSWTEKVLYSFKGLNDGGTPWGSQLIVDGSGNIYGVTIFGGTHDYGVVFELTSGPAGKWTEKVLHSFGVAGGIFPVGNLVMDAAGTLYGAATSAVFRLSPAADGTWTEMTVHTFDGDTDGANLYGGLLIDKAGNLYGTTRMGGAHRGTVFELSPGANGTWTEKILHRFSTNGGDGTFPQYGTLVMDSEGHLYDTTPQGGTSDHGAVFEVTR